MSKKSIIIVAICFFVIIVGLIVSYVLYLTTDLFKPSSQIFQRHFVQNLEIINEITDFSSEQNYINTLTQKNYKDNTNIKVSYKNSEGRLEEFNISSDGINNTQNKNTYRTISAKYGDNIDIINAEYLRENEMYGLLFQGIVNQFACIDANYLDLVFNKVNINKSEIEKYNISETWNLFQNKKLDVEKVCMNFASEISNNQYGSKKESVITLSNGEQKSTKEYSLKLNSEQTKNLFFNILREINKQDLIEAYLKEKKEFSETNMYINVLENQTVRISMEFENKQIIVDFYDSELNIKCTDLSTEEMKTINLDLKRQNDKKYIQYEDSYSNKVKLEMGESENTANIQISVTNNEIQQLDFSIEQTLEISETPIEIAKKFETEPKVILSKLNVRGINTALDSLLQLIDTKIKQKNNDINSEILNIWLNQNQKLETGYQDQKEKEKNNFNNQFKSYQGTEVEKNLVYNMLDVVSRNILKYEKVNDDKIIIYIKQGKANAEMVKEIKEFIIKDNDKFDIDLHYDSEGRIDAIKIEKSKEQKN